MKASEIKKKAEMRAEEKQKKANEKAANRKRKATEQGPEKAKKAKKSNAGEEMLQKILDTKLGDEDENGDVPVYDECDVVRRKINRFLGDKLVTKAAFLRALGNANSNSLRSFLCLTGILGSGNVVYRRGYAFFEKKRV